jgi:TPR repeat protein
MPKASAHSLDFARASELWDQGNHKRAYKAFLNLVEDGDAGAQLNVGYLYDLGIGVTKDETKALYWYRRAYRQKHPSAAINIGTVYRDRGERARAVEWFLRAAKLGDDSGLFMAAKLFLEDGTQQQRALKYLKTIVQSRTACQADVEEATRLLATTTRHRSAKPQKRN